MSFRKRKCSEHQITSSLLRRVYGLSPPGVHSHDALDRYEARAYLKYYKDLLYDDSLIQEEEVTLRHIDKQCDEVVEIVRIVQENRHRTISEVKEAVLSSSAPRWLVRQNDQRALSKMVDLAVRLWLFVPLHADKIARKRGLEHAKAMEDLDKTTIQIEAQRGIPPRQILHGTLSFDFTVESLVIKAGLTFRPTSILGQHLAVEDLARSSVVYVFRHVKALEKYQYEDHWLVTIQSQHLGLIVTDRRASDMYPDGFLEEVCRTIHLLFPIKDPKSIRRTKRLAKRYIVDVETDHEAHLGLDRLAQLDLASYSYFADRLKKLQDRYDKATPGTLRQLWYDRRRPVEWAILWVALVVFFLTLVFGLISSITGIVQVIQR